jgi:hypothetical protein
VTEQDDGAGADAGESAQQADELAHLDAVDLVTGEQVSGCIECDTLRFFFAGLFKNLLVELGRLDDPVAVRSRKHSVFAEQRQHTEACGDEVGVADAVVFLDGAQANVQLAHVVFGADVPGGPFFGDKAEPIASERGACEQVQDDEALPDRAFAAE